MKEYLQTIYECATEVSANEVMAALMIGFVLAIACTRLFLLLRNRVSDPLPLLCGLMLIVSAGSMAFGIGHSRYKLTHGTGATGWTELTTTAGLTNPSLDPRRLPPNPAGHPLGREMLEALDWDKDGRITAEEAVRFVREADKGEKGGADLGDIERYRQEHFRLPSMTDILAGHAPYRMVRDKF